jgi:hypothetical protein
MILVKVWEGQYNLNSLWMSTGLVKCFNVNSDGQTVTYDIYVCINIDTSAGGLLA